MKSSLLYLSALIFIITIHLSAQQKGATPIIKSQQSDVKSQLHNTYALVVCISDYQDSKIPDLRFSDKDAVAFANFLRSTAGGALDEDHLKVLINNNAKGAQIGMALDWLIEVSKENDQVIIYSSDNFC